MDEQILKLFADVGPNAQEALNSYVTLQWVKTFLDAGMCITFIIALFWGLLIIQKKRIKGE